MRQRESRKFMRGFTFTGQKLHITKRKKESVLLPDKTLYYSIRHDVPDETKCSGTGEYLYYEHDCHCTGFCDRIAVCRHGKCNYEIEMPEETSFLS